MLERLARFVIRHRRLVIGGWIVLTLFGAYSAKRVSNRWLEQFSIPGYSAYETNQRTLKTFGTGAQPPQVAVFTAGSDVTKNAGVKRAIARVAREFRPSAPAPTSRRTAIPTSPGTGTRRWRSSTRPASRGSMRIPELATSAPY
jgi:hypothetical protein